MEADDADRGCRRREYSRNRVRHVADARRDLRPHGHRGAEDRLSPHRYRPGLQQRGRCRRGNRRLGRFAGGIFITTKVHPERTSEAELVKSVEESLRKLGKDQVDLLLPHWPNPRIPVAETIRALCDAKRRGLTRNIGLSNYTIALTEEALRAATEPLVAAQIEYHPLVDQTKILWRRSGGMGWR